MLTTSRNMASNTRFFSLSHTPFGNYTHTHTQTWTQRKGKEKWNSRMGTADFLLTLTNFGGLSSSAIISLHIL